jgi:uncharacterized protein (TIGR00369 family)
VTEKLSAREGTFDGCFGCGSTNRVGLRLAFEKDGAVVRTRAVLGREYAGYRDFVHGGVVATILDEAMGWAMLHVAGRHGVTKTLSVSYRRPVLVDRAIVATARVADENGSSIVLDARIEDEVGRLLASARGEWAVVREERSA